METGFGWRTRYADVTSPLSVIEAVAVEDESFDETFTKADTNGDGVPDTNLETVYDAPFEATRSGPRRSTPEP